jgi:hypothetical protein
MEVLILNSEVDHHGEHVMKRVCIFCQKPFEHPRRLTCSQECFVAERKARFARNMAAHAKRLEQLTKLSRDKKLFEERRAKERTKQMKSENPP